MDSNFLTPINSDLFDFDYFKSMLNIGGSIQVYTEQQGFPDLEDVSVAVIGVKENLEEFNSDSGGVALVNLRKQFYDLFPGNWKISIADLGDVLASDNEEDTHFAVSNIISSLVKKGIIPILIGGNQGLTYANYRAYDKLEQTVNLVSVDSRFDLGGLEDESSSKSFMSKVIMETPNNLFNYSVLGYQTYFNSQEEIKLLDKLYFDAYRLGELKNIELVEPIMRDADIVSVDISAVRLADAPGTSSGSPNGFDGNQICAIARYAGISDKVTSFGIYEYVSDLDVNEQTAGLIAQIIWYFIEGVDNRIKDYPFSTKDTYGKFIVVLDDDDPINFYKSDKSGRWWMEINLISDNKFKRHALIPCVYNDYLKALNQEIPSRWFKALKKLS